AGVPRNEIAAGARAARGRRGSRRLSRGIAAARFALPLPGPSLRGAARHRGGRGSGPPTRSATTNHRRQRLRSFASRYLVATLVALAASFATAHGQTTSASPATAAPTRAPDVIFVPTPQQVVDAMLEMAQVGPNDVLYDLGSGDGRIPITA